MKKFVILAVFTLTLAPLAFSATNPARQLQQQRGTEPPAEGLWNVYDNKGYLIRQENYKSYRLGGEVKSFYQSGTVREIANYVDGYRQGPTRVFYEDSRLQGEGTYKDNNLEGQYVRYYQTGEIESVSNYSNGHLDGEKKTYFKSGELKRRQNFRKGVLHGTSISYLEDGKVELEENYDKGVLISRKEYKDEADLISVPQAAAKKASPTATTPALSPKEN